MTGPLTSEFSDVEAPPIILPEPECPAVEMTDEEIAGGVKSVVKNARTNGFDVRVTYARGPWQHATQNSYVVKQMIRVAGHHADGRAFIATWLSANYPKPQAWKFNTAQMSKLGLCSSVVLGKYIKGEKVE